MSLLAVATSTVSARANGAFDPTRLEPMFEMPRFGLTDQNGKPFESESLKGNPAILAFVFTRCAGPCPVMFAEMAAMQGRIADHRVKFILITIDPKRDTPEVLKRKLSELKADESRWSFLTGGIPEIFRIQKEMMLAHGRDENDLVHSDRFMLFDKAGVCRGRFDGKLQSDMTELVGAANHLLNEPVQRSRAATVIPLINSCFNGLSTLLLISGFLLIRSGNWKAHAVCMSLALGSSALFLVGYLLNKYLYGTHFSGLPPGALRTGYFILLTSHTILAIAVLPLVFVTVLRVVNKKWDKHRMIARPTLAVWLYVSVTGVIVYLALYQLFPRLNS